MDPVGQTGPTSSRVSFYIGLVTEVASLVGRLLRDEFSLAGAELGQSARRGAVALALIVVGAVLIMSAIVAGCVSGIAALSLVMPVWQAAGCVALGILVTGVVIAMTGALLLRRISFVPERTRRSVTATVEWFKERMD